MNDLPYSNRRQQFIEQLGLEAACRAFGFDAAHPIGDLEKMLPELIANRQTLWHSLGHDAVCAQRKAGQNVGAARN